MASRSASRPLRDWGSTLISPRARLIAMLGFLAIVFLTGGGSRSDIVTLPFLRPFAVLMATYALIAMPKVGLAPYRMPLIFAALLAALMAVQLIPLPYAIWSALPGRNLVAQIDAAAGFGQVARPFTLSPAATINSLLSITVPLAALLLFAAQEPKYRRFVAFALVGAAAFSAVFGALQLIAGTNAALYPYRMTNLGSAVGLFANRNHNAVFMAATIILCAKLFLFERRRTVPSTPVLAGLAGVALFLVPSVLVTGSRAGALCLALSVLCAFVLLLPVLKNQKLGRWSGRPVLAAMFVACLALCVSAVWMSGRTTALDRIAGGNVTQDMRARTSPVILAMTAEHAKLGAGFGSFEHIYRVAEPDELLIPTYNNHAHNDWAEWIMEGGVPMILLLLATLAWIVIRTRSSIQQALSHHRDLSGPLWPVLALAQFMLASAFDYPLRTPALAAVGAILIGFVAAGHLAQTHHEARRS